LRYYRIQQNKEYANAPRTSDMNEKLDTKNFYLNRSYNIPLRTVINIHPNRNISRVDFLYQTIPLISSRIKDVIERFENGVIYKEVVLFDPETTWNQMYYIPFFYRLSSDVLLSPSIRELSSGRESTDPIKLKLPHTLPVFCISNRSSYNLFMRIDLTESLLRNGARGLKLSEANDLEG